MKTGDPLDRFLSAILRDRRPPRFEADSEQAELLQTATALRAARPGADLPDPRFLDRLQERLRRAACPPAPPRVGRRAFLRAAGLAAAATAGVALDRGIASLHPQGGSEATTPAEELVPDGAGWHAVASLAELRARRAVGFRIGGVDGYLIDHAGGVVALSATCTHMGCRLAFDRASTSLLCPCHSAAFGSDGRPLDREYLRPLPRLRTRLVGDTVEVLA